MTLMQNGRVIYFSLPYLVLCENWYNFSPYFWTKMPNTITFEREKLNQAMYQKLKKFIMNKRKREAEGFFAKFLIIPLVRTRSGRLL